MLILFTYLIINHLRSTHFFIVACLAISHLLVSAPLPEINGTAMNMPAHLHAQ